MSTADQILSRGWREGMPKGMQQGLQQDLAQTVLRCLDGRSGPLDDATIGRIRAATLAELEPAAMRLLTAPTLAAVFTP